MRWLALYVTIFVWTLTLGVDLVRWLRTPLIESVEIEELVEAPSRGGWKMPSSEITSYTVETRESTVSYVPAISYDLVPAGPRLGPITKLPEDIQEEYYTREAVRRQRGGLSAVQLQYDIDNVTYYETFYDRPEYYLMYNKFPGHRLYRVEFERGEGIMYSVGHMRFRCREHPEESVFVAWAGGPKRNGR